MTGQRAGKAAPTPPSRFRSASPDRPRRSISNCNYKTNRFHSKAALRGARLIVSDTLLSTQDRQEALSRAYASAIAAGAGYVTYVPDYDRDSIDLGFIAAGRMRRTSMYSSRRQSIFGEPVSFLNSLSRKRTMMTSESQRRFLGL